MNTMKIRMDTRIMRNLLRELQIQIPTHIHKTSSKQYLRSGWLNPTTFCLSEVSMSFLIPSSTILILCFLILVGCGGQGQLIEPLLESVDASISKAKQADAEILAKQEFQNAKSSRDNANKKLQMGETNQALLLLHQAEAQARLAEAIAKQRKVESEASQMEKELQNISTQAAKVNTELIEAEKELKKYKNQTN
ncbi:DUF4398 domain-containing protein [Candidatus Poribacteria bacterium]|nr:DUF4398 domain-containing protein [Candidatus Poribacteria bacterium]